MVGIPLALPSLSDWFLETMSSFSEERSLSSPPTAHLILTQTGNSKFQYRERVNALHEN